MRCVAIDDSVCPTGIVANGDLIDGSASTCREIRRVSNDLHTVEVHDRGLPDPTGSNQREGHVVELSACPEPEP